MMAIYKLRYSEGFEWLLPYSEHDMEALRFIGEQRAAFWHPVRMRRLRISAEGKSLKAADFPACSGGDIWILSAVAKKEIGRWLERAGELLPLAADHGEFWILNVTRFVDALDENNSKLLRASDTGAVLMIREHAFKEIEIIPNDLFKLPQTKRGLIYVTDDIPRIVFESGLTGLEFIRLWPLE